MRIVRLVSTLLVSTGVAALVSAVSSGASQPSREGMVGRLEAAGIARVSYEWHDPNTEKILRWKGDTRFLDPGSAPTRFRYTAEVPLDRLRNAIESFGVTDDQLTFTFSSESDLRQKEAQRKARLESRGLRIEESENVVGIAYEWVVDKSREDLKATTVGLTSLGAKSRYASARDIWGLIASFVQSLEYRIPDQYRNNAKGQKVWTCGITMPLETLYNGWGDCDTKCLMFASMLASFSNTSVVFLEGNKHTFVGIRGTPRSNDLFVKIKGIPYVLVELTDTWPLGRIPNDTWLELGRNQFRIFPIFANE